MKLEEKVEKLQEIWGRKIRNKKKVTKAVIMASYDDYPNADNYVREQAKNERKSGNFYLNHLILRDKKEEIDNLKFNYLIDGIPSLAYVLMNAYKSDLEDVVVVGNADSEKIFNEFVSLYNVNKNKRFRFVNEGTEWNIENTLRKGKENIKQSDNELVLLLPGDLPFCYDLNKIINDKDIKKYEFISNLNSRELVGKHFPRNYHARIKTFFKTFFKNLVKTLKIVYNAKESNPYLLNINKAPLKKIGLVFKNRKSYVDFKDSNKEISLINIIFGNGQWKEYARTLKGDIPFVVRILPKITSRIKKKKIKYPLNIISIPVYLYNKYIQKKPPIIKLHNLQDSVDLYLNMKTKIKITNKDPATIEDHDSYEDWCYMNKMISEGKSEIYLHYDEIQKFRQVMPKLRNEIKLYKNYEEHINSIFRKFGLFGKPYYKDGTPFLLRESFNSRNELDIEFAKDEVNSMVKKNIGFHNKYLLRYNKRLKRKQLFRKEYK